MGNRVARDDYEWVYTEQPHADRRKAILGELTCDPDVSLHQCNPERNTFVSEIFLFCLCYGRNMAAAVVSLLLCFKLS